jgi:PST family polysaccharide transporter
MLGGSARMLLAESLFPLVGLITAAFLTRELRPGEYGLLALTLTTVIWVENAITAFFSKATIKLVGETDDWRLLGAHVIRRTTLTGIAAAAGIMALAGPISSLLGHVELARTLRLAALNIPILCTALAYRSVLIGTSRFRAGAIGRAARWVARLCLVILFVKAGWAVNGALAGVIGSSLVELAVYRWHVGPGMFRRLPATRLPVRQYGTLLFGSSLSLSAFSSMDLLMVTMLGGSAGLAGVYGAAQSLALLPSLFLWTFSSVLLATVSRLRADRAEDAATTLACDALRWTMWLLPLAAIVAGSASDIVQTVFGPAFAAAGPILAVLIVGAVASVTLGVALTLMTAVGRPSRTLLYSASLVPVALSAHLLVVPRWGAGGATVVTAAVSSLAAISVIADLRVTSGIAPPAATVVRSVLVAVAAGALSMVWRSSGLFVFAEMAAVAAMALVCYRAAGEFRASELAVVRAIVFRNRAVPMGLDERTAELRRTQ